MRQPKLCVVHETVGRQSAIAQIAAWNARVGREAGFEVSVLAANLDDEWRERTQGEDFEHIPLWAPRRSFALQWLSAQARIKRALQGRDFDVIHVHQPQATPLSDVFTCHFLTRVARESGGLPRGQSARASFARAQQELVLRVEDYIFRHANPRSHFLFCSALIEREFTRLYGAHPRGQVMVNFAPPFDAPDAEERRAARQKLAPNAGERLVVGYLGGRDERKGYRKLLRAVLHAPGLFVLMGGPHSDEISAPALESQGRFRTLGMVKNLREFYAACDVMAVPSSFDPCPLVCFEAASRAVPVLATPRVGNLSDLLRHGAGAAWNGRAPLEPLVRELAQTRESHASGARELCEELSQERQGARLLEVYEAVVREKRDNRESSLMRSHAA